jgi:hypothetical protein
MHHTTQKMNFILNRGSPRFFSRLRGTHKRRAGGDLMIQVNGLQKTIEIQTESVPTVPGSTVA